MSELIAGEIITGERNYEAALDLVIAQAERELLIFDQDFAKGAYGSLRRYELLRTFLSKGPQVSLVIILQQADGFQLRCPRLFELLNAYGHVMKLHQLSEQAQSAKDAFVVVDQKHCLRRFHIDQARFKYQLDDPESAGVLNMRFHELLQVASHSVSTTMLGL